MQLLKLRALVVPASSAFRAGAFTDSRRTFKYLVRQSAIAESSRFATSGSTTKDVVRNNRQFFERTWTLSGSRPLEKLKLSLPGVTFISSADFEEDDDNDHVAKILVTSDSVEILEGVSVKSKLPYRTLLDFHPSPRTSRGNLLTEILLPRGFSGNPGGLLRSLGVKGDELVIVEDGVLANETIRLAATQGERLAIESTEDLDVGKLQIAVANRSKVYLHAPNVSARDRIEIAGIGGSEAYLQSQAGFSTSLLKVAIAGSGKVRVQAQSFAVDEMKSAIAGSGRIVIVGGDGSGSSASVSTASITTGGCNSHNVAIIGAGDVDCADVSTSRAYIAVAGQTTLALEAQDALTLSAFGETKLAYLKAPPRMITLKNYHASSPLAPMSEEDRSTRKQQQEAEAQELQDFWRSLPSRETALGVKK